MKLIHWSIAIGLVLYQINAIPSEDEILLQDEGFGSFKSHLRNENMVFRSNAVGNGETETSDSFINIKMLNANSNIYINPLQNNDNLDKNLNKNNNNNNNNNKNNSNTSNTSDTVNISNISNTGNTSNTNNSNTNKNNISSTAIQYNKISYTDTGFKDSLSSFETYLYNKLLINSKKSVPEFTLVIYPLNDGFSIDFKNIKVSMVTAFISFMYDHSEFWWIYSYRYNCEYSSKTFEVKKMEIDLCWSNDFCTEYSPKKIKSMDDALHSQKLNIIAEFGDITHKTSYQILRNIHDALIRHVTLITSDAEEDMFSPTVYGALVNGKCTNEGLAKAFKWFAEYFKITNVLAVGYGYQWNFIKLNDRWYVIDVAEDAIRSPNPDIAISYDIFLIGFSDITDTESSLSYENDNKYNLIDRVRSTSNSLTYITYPEVHILNFFDTNGINKEDIFESTILSITPISSYKNEVVPDPTNHRITTLISTFTTTVVTVVQGQLNLTVVAESIKNQHNKGDETLSVTNINNKSTNNGKISNQRYLMMKNGKNTVNNATDTNNTSNTSTTTTTTNTNTTTTTTTTNSTDTNNISDALPNHIHSNFILYFTLILIWLFFTTL